MSTMLLSVLVGFLSAILVVVHGSTDFFEKKENQLQNETCLRHQDCPVYSKCNRGDHKCYCLSDYVKERNNCVLKDGRLGDKCARMSDCKEPNSFCSALDNTCQCGGSYKQVKEECINLEPVQCTEGQYLRGSQCIPEEGGVSDICSGDYDCKKNSFCSQVFGSKSCQCKDDYFLQGYICVKKFDPPQCRSDGDCSGVDGAVCRDGWCDCASGWERLGHHCLLTNTYPSPEKREARPDDWHNNRSPDRRYTSSGWPITNSESSIGSFKWIMPHRRYPAISPDITFGGHGHYCRAKRECKFYWLTCDFQTYTCACVPPLKLEGNDCVGNIEIDMQPGQTYTYTSSSQTSSINHGNECHSPLDCYHEGLWCDLQQRRCVCASPYVQEAGNCVKREVSPLEPDTVDQPIRNVNPYWHHVPPPPPPLMPNPYAHSSRGTGEDRCLYDKHCPKLNMHCNKLSGVCECMYGFIKRGSECITRSADSCIYHSDCGYNSLCQNSVCICEPGYVKTGRDCHPIKQLGAYKGLGHFCNNDEECHFFHSQCYQQRCRCAQTFHEEHGICQPEAQYLGSSCFTGYPCQENSECSYHGGKCECRKGFSAYGQTCVQDGYLHGFCVYNSCYSPDLKCDRSVSKCKCRLGYKQNGLNCIPDHYSYY